MELASFKAQSEDRQRAYENKRHSYTHEVTKNFNSRGTEMEKEVEKAKAHVRDRQQAYWNNTAEAGKQTQQGQRSVETQSASVSVSDGTKAKRETATV